MKIYLNQFFYITFLGMLYKKSNEDLFESIFLIFNIGVFKC